MNPKDDPESAATDAAAGGEADPPATGSGRVRQDREPLPPVVDRVTFKLHRVNARIAQMCNPVFARYEIDIYSSRILALLFERTAMRVGDLVEAMVLPQSTISHQLKRLEQQGLIRRERSAEDNRAVSVTLTDKGLETARACDRLSMEVYGRIVSGLDEEELRNVRAVLDRLWANLDRF